MTVVPADDRSRLLWQQSSTGHERLGEAVIQRLSLAPRVGMGRQIRMTTVWKQFEIALL